MSLDYEDFFNQLAEEKKSKSTIKPCMNNKQLYDNAKMINYKYGNKSTTKSRYAQFSKTYSQTTVIDSKATIIENLNETSNSLIRLRHLSQTSAVFFEISIPEQPKLPLLPALRVSTELKARLQALYETALLTKPGMFLFLHNPYKASLRKAHNLLQPLLTTQDSTWTHVCSVYQSAVELQKLLQLVKTANYTLKKNLQPKLTAELKTLGTALTALSSNNQVILLTSCTGNKMTIEHLAAVNTYLSNLLQTLPAEALSKEAMKNAYFGVTLSKILGIESYNTWLKLSS